MINYESEFVKRVMVEKNMTREEAVKDTLNWLGIDKDRIDKIAEYVKTKKFDLIKK